MGDDKDEGKHHLGGISNHSHKKKEKRKSAVALFEFFLLAHVSYNPLPPFTNYFLLCFLPRGTPCRLYVDVQLLTSTATTSGAGCCATVTMQCADHVDAVAEKGNNLFIYQQIQIKLNKKEIKLKKKKT